MQTVMVQVIFDRRVVDPEGGAVAFQQRAGEPLTMLSAPQRREGLLLMPRAMYERLGQPGELEVLVVPRQGAS